MKYTKTLLIFFTIIALVLLAVFSYCIYEIRSKAQVASLLSNEADVASEQETLSLSIQSIRNSSKNDIAALDQYILRNEKLVPFIEFIENSGKSLGLQIKIASVSSEKSDTRKPLSYEKVHLMIETEGSWKSSINFIHALENLPTGASIDSSVIEVGEDVFTTASSTKSSLSGRAVRTWHTSTSITLASFK